MIIAVDGPAGSGKSTISKLIAEKLNVIYLDTGAMYRSITVLASINKLDINNISDKELLIKLASEASLELTNNQVKLNNQDITQTIRESHITQQVSAISAIKEIREILVNKQREIASKQSSILDGRDIGTVVFPNADLKIFLTASPEERANRRYKEQQAKQINTSQTYKEVLDDIILRDKLDTEREESPLTKAPDAIEIDTDNLNIEQVVNKIIELIN